MQKNLETIHNVVIGTAGHIDHGKSRLVEAMTGIDPDRLPEEKSRGLTIDLGFAPFRLSDGRRVGVVDVPGHERLIKNMVAGATGIDLVLLVVAADDGAMPQTREHVTIMEVLGLTRGLVAITKIDLVDAELRELVREDVREALAGTFLQDAPIVEVSSVSGEGIDSLRQRLEEEILKCRPRPSGGCFRMPIQRVFSPRGFGTVVTGIPLSGSTTVGDTLEILPLGARGRVRGIQAYKEATDLSRAGHSSALNLGDVDYRSVSRGMAACAPGYFRASVLIEASFRYLPRTRRPLRHQSLIRLHVGTAEVIGKVCLLESKRLEPGEETFVQLRLEEPVVTAPGDRYVLRQHSPMETLGGGEVLGTSRWRLKSGKRHVIERLRRRRETLADPLEFLLAEIDGAGFRAPSRQQLATATGRTLDEVETAISTLVEEGRVLRAARAGLVLSVGRLEEGRDAALERAAEYFREFPRRLRMDRAQLRDRLGCDDVFLLELLGRLETAGEVVSTEGGKTEWRDLGAPLGEEEKEIEEKVAACLREDRFTPRSPAELAEEEGWDEAVTAELFDLLVERGVLRKLAENIYFHEESLEAARGRLREHLLEAGTMTAAVARSVLETTRKYCIPLLELLDREQFTIRRGDVRTLAAR